MTHWYREAQEQRELHALERQTRNGNAEILFAELWHAITQEIPDINKQRGEDQLPLLGTNGSAFDRVINVHYLPHGVSRSQLHILHITLDDKREVITAASESCGDDLPAVSLSFAIQAGSDGVVYLSHNQKRLDTRKTATAILRAFLFPDLPQKI